MNKRDVIVATARGLVGSPYFIGADGPREFDCNGAIERCWKSADVYPWPVRRAARDYPTLPHVEWEDRLPGDVVCFGPNPAVCSHVALVADLSTLIGANHGGPKIPLEDDDDYRRRMKAADQGRGARVCVVGADYWKSARLCVVRAPALFDDAGAIV